MSSWNIGNKEVASLSIGGKEVQSIVRVSDGAVLYEKPASYSITLVANKYSASTGESVTFTATVVDGNNQPVSGQTVTFKEGNNVLGTGVTNASGICSVSYSWNYTNTLNIQAEINNYVSNTVSVTIRQGKINTGIINRGGYFYLIDINDNPLPNKTVYVLDVFEDYYVITDMNGKICPDDVILCQFDGDDNYNGCHSNY